MSVKADSLVSGLKVASLQAAGRRPLAVALVCAALAGGALAGDIRITIPKRTKPTPVQNLNRDGVKAVEKHDYERAKRLFYKAYLLDPNDPFTLNNLGYIAELEGEVERAQRFYALAQEQESEAMVDRATTESVIGKPVALVAGNAEANTMQVNRLNVNAIGLLLKDRAPEADVLLGRALAVEPDNPFTLNNLGFAKEKQGEMEAALSYYTKAANLRSEEPVIVTVHKSWRGRGISEVAARNAEKVREMLSGAETAESKVARLNLQGVSALNRNDRRRARAAFEQAYKLKSDDAFALNNMGYLAELDGDRETANFFYEKARAAERADARVLVATRKEAEGQRLAQVAEESTNDVAARQQADLEAKRRAGGPVVLKRRDNRPVAERQREPEPQPTAVAAPGPQTGTPENAEPAATTVEQLAPEPALVTPEELETTPKVEGSQPPR